MSGLIILFESALRLPERAADNPPRSCPLVNVPGNRIRSVSDCHVWQHGAYALEVFLVAQGSTSRHVRRNCVDGSISGMPPGDCVGVEIDVCELHQFLAGWRLRIR